MLRYQMPIWPERALTRHDAAELERLVRSRASAKWVASEDFSETIGYMRRAIQIPSAAHSALEYQRWAVRSQLRSEGRRFMRLMKRPLAVPMLHLRGDADPYVLADAGEPHTAVRAARPLRIHRRGRPFRPRGGAGRGQRPAIALPGSQRRRHALTHRPVGTGVVLPILPSW